ncbi:MAG: GNAT family N-acetyltransferase, partial [Chloroflexota bacterium]
MSFTIRRAAHEDKSDWLRMRQSLWPDAPVEYLSYDLEDHLADPDYAVFLAFDAEGRGVAFIETGLRDYGEACETSPVGYIEAWYVDERMRGQKLGRELIHAA